MKHIRKRFIHERDNYICFYCNQKCVVSNHGNNRITIDHVIPISKGGSNALTNVVTSCFLCNIKKADKVLSREEVSKIVIKIPKQISQVKKTNKPFLRKEEFDCIRKHKEVIFNGRLYCEKCNRYLIICG